MSKFNCDCIEKVDDYLGKKNTRITQALVLDPNSQSPGVMIETEQVETGRGKPKAVGMFASHCPFCGMKYGEIKGIDLTEGMLSLSWRIIHALTVHGFENDADISKLLESHQPLILTAIKNAFNDTATNPYKAELVKLAALVGEKDDPFAAWEKLQPIVEDAMALDRAAPNGPVTGDQLRTILGLEPEEALDPEGDGRIGTCAGEWLRDPQTSAWTFEEDEDD